MSAVSDSNGKLYAAFQYFPSDDAANFDKVAVKTSTDDGVTWSEPTPAKFANYPKSYSRPFDPTLAVMPEGKIRMYFTVNTSLINTPTDNTLAYYSAISDDGINYTLEPGERFSIEGKNVVDSAIAYYNNLWHLHAPTQKEQGAEGIYYHATSEDGLKFSEPTQIETSKGNEWTGNFIEINGKLRFYGASKNIFYSESTDGFTWSTPVSTNSPGGDPSVVKAGNKYLVIYTAMNAPKK